MAFRDLIPWSWQENRFPVPVSAERSRDNDTHPLLSLHREVNRLFDDVYQGLAAPSFGNFHGGLSWPNVEFGKTDRVRITAQLPCLDEKDSDITAEEGVLTLRGEKKSEIEDKERGHTERSYGRCERRIRLPRGIERDKANAMFRNGVLAVTLPKSAAANDNDRPVPSFERIVV